MKRLLIAIFFFVAVAVYAQDQYPIEIISLEYNDSGIEIVWKKNVDKTIEAIEYSISFYDAFGEPIVIFGDAEQEYRMDRRFTRELTTINHTGFWGDSQIRSLRSFTPIQVAFSDGTIWVNEDGTGVE